VSVRVAAHKALVGLRAGLDARPPVAP